MIGSEKTEKYSEADIRHKSSILSFCIQTRVLVGLSILTNKMRKLHNPVLRNFFSFLLFYADCVI